jgi:hypothetical protein
MKVDQSKNLVKIDNKLIEDLVKNSSFDLDDIAYCIEERTENTIEIILKEVDKKVKEYLQIQINENLKQLGLDKNE